jgi:hypothetical protein
MSFCFSFMFFFICKNRNIFVLQLKQMTFRSLRFEKESIFLKQQKNFFWKKDINFTFADRNKFQIFLCVCVLSIFKWKDLRDLPNCVKHILLQNPNRKEFLNLLSTIVSLRRKYIYDCSTTTIVGCVVEYIFFQVNKALLSIPIKRFLSFQFYYHYWQCRSLVYLLVLDNFFLLQSRVELSWFSNNLLTWYLNGN